uniref:Uncharacterized protein n=1 Tax=Micrurus surinamensis TaxID=129470 RepID=A0A2D4PWX8_MICSU
MLCTQNSFFKFAKHRTKRPVFQTSPGSSDTFDLPCLLFSQTWELITKAVIHKARATTLLGSTSAIVQSYLSRREPVQRRLVYGQVNKRFILDTRKIGKHDEF